MTIPQTQTPQPTQQQNSQEDKLPFDVHVELDRIAGGGSSESLIHALRTQVFYHAELSLIIQVLPCSTVAEQVKYNPVLEEILLKHRYLLSKEEVQHIEEALSKS